MSHRLFAYGTLRAPEVMGTVAGRDFEHDEAWLSGYAAYRVLGADYPAMVPEPSATTQGTLWWGLNDAALRRLDRFEGDLYVRKRLRVQAAGGACQAWVYLLRPLYRGRLSQEKWDYHRFREGGLDRYLGAAAARG